MSSVDNRIVQMRFDNKQFESGISQSRKSIENLKSNLNMEGAVKGLGESVDFIKNKFTALGIVGVTALVNITNSAVNAAKNLVSSLTVDPVKMGLDEYETKMNAITTILTNTASKGTTLKDVNETLNELNTYADKTIYNFAEMTRNIGTFTAAGIDLKTSALAIKGIANLAAGSGSSAQQASTAMYQLSQALAAGKVNLMDWNSVVNAGMGGELFKKNLMETAKAMKLIKTEMVDGQEMIVTYTKNGKKELKTFRESLQDGWLTSKVLVTTLEKFANDESLLKAATQVKTLTQLIDTMKESVQSGWAQSWENIIGDREEASQIFTAVNDEFSRISGASADARNQMLSFWKANGGRQAIIDAITNSFQGLKAILKPIHEAFREVFPAMTGERLVAISKAIRDLTAHFKIGAETAANIKLSFKGLFAVLDMGLKVIKFIIGGIGKLISILMPGTGSLLNITAAIGKFLVSMNDMIDSSGVMEKTLDGLGVAFAFVTDIIRKGLEAAKPLLTGLKNIISGLIKSFEDLFKGQTVFAATLEQSNDSFSTAEKGTSKFKKALDGLHTALTKIKDIIVSVAKGIGKVLSPILDSLKKKFDQMNFRDIGALLTGAGFLTLAKALSKGLSSIDDILGNFSNILGQVGDTLKAFQLKVKAEALLKIAIALGILAVALVVLSKIDIVELGKALGALTISLIGMVLALKSLNKMTDTIGLFKKQTKLQLIGLGISILLLAFAAKTLASVPFDKLALGVGAIAALMTLLVLFMKFTSGSNLKASAGGLIAFSIGIVILSAALAILGKMKPETLNQGAVALGGLMLVIAAFVKATSGASLKASAGGLMGFATGIMILSVALAILGKMKPETLEQGAVAIGGLMLVIAAFIKATSGSSLRDSAGGLMGFAVGIMILSVALAMLGSIKPETLLQGAIAIGALMGAILLFIKYAEAGKLATSSAGLIGFATGLLILTGALVILSMIDPTTMANSMLALLGMMLAIGTFIQVTKEGDLAASSAGIIGFAAGLVILSAALAIISLINPEKLTGATVAMAALMVSIALFVNLTRSADLGNSAVGLVGFSAGLMILAGVLAILSALDADGILKASVAISSLMMVIALFVKLTTAGDLIKSSAGLIIFSAGIAVMAVALQQLSKMNTGNLLASAVSIALLIGVLTIFTKVASSPMMLLGAVSLVAMSGAILVMAVALKMLDSVGPGRIILNIIALAAAMLILGVASLVMDLFVPAMALAAATLLLFGAACLAIGGGIDLFANGIRTLAEVGSDGAKALVEILTGIINLIPLTLQKLAEGIVAFAKTIADGSPEIFRAVLGVIEGILDTAVKAIPKMVEAGMKIVAGILQGIADNIGKVIDAGANMIIKFMEGVSSAIPRVVDAGFKALTSFLNGLATAIRTNVQPIKDAARNLVDALAYAIKELSPDMGKAGGDMMRGFIQGVKDMAGDVAKSAKSVVKGAVDGVKDFLGIHSPSRVFAEIGKYSVEGFAGGLTKYSGLASEEATNLGINAVDSLKNAMAKASDTLNNNVDMNPTIRPVLDLSDIQNGGKRLYSMMGQYDGYAISGSVQMANGVARGMSAPQGGTTTGKTTATEKIVSQQTQQNTFYISGDDPQSIAEEVANILQKQVERRDAVWGY